MHRNCRGWSYVIWSSVREFGMSVCGAKLWRIAKQPNTFYSLSPSRNQQLWRPLFFLHINTFSSHSLHPLHYLNDMGKHKKEKTDQKSKKKKRDSQPPTEPDDEAPAVRRSKYTIHNSYCRGLAHTPPLSRLSSEGQTHWSVFLSL